MSGTLVGGKKASHTNTTKYGSDYYKKIGEMGGKAGKGHKFAHGKVDPSVAGALGGRISRRGKKPVVINYIPDATTRFLDKFRQFLKIA